MKCEDESTKEEHQSYGRRKRSSEDTGSKSLELQAGDVVTDITMETPLFVVSSTKHAARPSAADSDRRKSTDTSGMSISNIIIFCFI